MGMKKDHIHWNKSNVRLAYAALGLDLNNEEEFIWENISDRDALEI